ncbi:MAG: GIY-YIG nuclease family protein [Candidatus Bathyarchaeota archaeon]|nr:MAG: GIY-YIG nuclease family protein [Candidatus Bathyarchaeota archaeon]
MKTTVDSTSMLPINGIYTLIVSLSIETWLKVGKLGIQRFPAGYYTYTGSALGIGASSLKQRVARHLKIRKSKFWHIDFLLAHTNACMEAECNINRSIKERLKAKIPVAGFGASDCKQNCESHLLYFGAQAIRSQVSALYVDTWGIRPHIIDLA